MERTQIYLSKDEQAELQKLAKKTGKSKSQLIRDAVDAYLELPSQIDRKEILANTKGIWRDRTDLPDFEELRREWDR